MHSGWIGAITTSAIFIRRKSEGSVQAVVLPRRRRPSEGLTPPRLRYTSSRLFILLFVPACAWVFRMTIPLMYLRMRSCESEEGVQHPRQ